jgi:hypothetical protein
MQGNGDRCGWGLRDGPGHRPCYRHPPAGVPLTNSPFLMTTRRRTTGGWCKALLGQVLGPEAAVPRMTTTRRRIWVWLMALPFSGNGHVH